MEVSGQLHAPEKEPPALIGKQAGWAPETLWTTCIGKKSFPYRDSNFNLSAVQPVASRCTDWAKIGKKILKKK
jgi:hypothetical protein